MEVRTCLLMGWWGPGALAVVWPPGFTYRISFAPECSFIYMYY